MEDVNIDDLDLRGDEIWDLLESLDLNDPSSETSTEEQTDGSGTQA